MCIGQAIERGREGEGVKGRREGERKRQTVKETG